MEGLVVGGRYRILAPLGAGGMGLVYEAEHVETGRRVALKLLLKGAFGGDGAEAASKRFLREARAIGTLESPHIVQVYDAGTDPDTNRAFIAMERLTGADFAGILKKTGPLAPLAALKVVGQACAGVGVAHQHGILHRDVKPGNLFLCQAADGTVVVKVLDFGLAKITNDARLTQITGSCEVMGTPAYMSPEQARGLSHTATPSDVWSLGVVLYKAIAGSTPHPTGGSFVDQVIALCSEPVEPLRLRAPWAPPEICSIVDRALCLLPEDRFPNAPAMLDAIRELVPDLSLHEAELVPAAVPSASATVSIQGAGPRDESPPAAPIPTRRGSTHRAAAWATVVVLTLCLAAALTVWLVGPRSAATQRGPGAPFTSEQAEPTTTAGPRNLGSVPPVASGSDPAPLRTTVVEPNATPSATPDPVPPSATSVKEKTVRAPGGGGQVPQAKSSTSQTAKAATPEPAPALTMESSFE